MAERMRQSDYAKRRGLSKQRVHQLKADGRVVVGPDGLVDVEASDRNLATMIDQRKATMARQIELAAAPAPAPALSPVQKLILADATHELGEKRATAGDDTEAMPADPPAEARPTASNAAADYWTHKALREASEAALAELKLQERLGSLVELREVARIVREIVARTANKLLQKPAQLAPVIASMQDPGKVETLLLEATQQVMNELAREFDQFAASATAGRPATLQ